MLSGMEGKMKWMILAAIVLLGIAIFPFLALSFYVFPAADDFSIACLLQKYDSSGYQAEMYLTWTGRYVTNFIESHDPAASNSLFMYRMVPLLLLILLYCALFLLFTVALQPVIKIVRRHLLSAAGLVLYLNVLPSPAESLYWFPGGVEYFFASVLSTFLLAVLIKICTSKGSGIRLYFLTGFICCFLIAGLNEISMMIVAGLLLLLSIFGFYKKSYWRFSILSLLLFHTAAGLLSVLAPGNYERMQYFDGSMDIVSSVSGAFSSLIKITGLMIQSPPFILITLLVLLFTPLIFPLDNLHKILPPVNPLLSTAISAIFIFALYLPGHFATGLPSPMRVHSVVALFFILLWFYNLLIAINHIKRKGLIVASLPFAAFRFIAIAAFVLMFVDFTRIPGEETVYRGNVIRAWTDLTSRAEDYKRQMIQRDNVLVNARGKQKLLLAPITVIPETIFFIDITDDPSHWMNQRCAEFYGIDTLAIQADNETEKEVNDGEIP